MSWFDSLKWQIIGQFHPWLFYWPYDLHSRPYVENITWLYCNMFQELFIGLKRFLSWQDSIFKAWSKDSKHLWFPSFKMGVELGSFWSASLWFPHTSTSCRNMFSVLWTHSKFGTFVKPNSTWKFHLVAHFKSWLFTQIRFTWSNTMDCCFISKTLAKPNMGPPNLFIVEKPQMVLLHLFPIEKKA